jgi:hypothetical protein
MVSLYIFVTVPKLVKGEGKVKWKSAWEGD